MEDPYPGLVRLSALRRWMDMADLGRGRDLAVERLTGGLSNENFLLRRGDQCWVLRRPAAVPLAHPGDRVGATDGANRIIVREYRFQFALREVGYPVARPRALCRDRGVIGAAFLVMDHVDGLVPDDPVQTALGGAAAGHRVAGAMVDALGDLAAVDHVELGLSDLGRPIGFLNRQVDRWRGQLEAHRRRDLPGIDRVADWLEANRPTSFVPGLMHGDFGRHNLLFSRGPGPTRLLAVLDWENATVGDPLLDLGYLLSGWHEPVDGWDDPDVALERPSRAATVVRWRERSGRDVADLGWYAVMSRFRLACMLEGVYQRSAEDPTREADPEVGQLVLGTVALADRLRAEAADW